MQERLTIFVLSDIHFASEAEKKRGCTEFQVVRNPLLRVLVRAYRHFIWLRHPFEQNHLLDQFLEQASAADYVIANGDYSCDTAFIGLSDDACLQSAKECLTKLRNRFGSKFYAGLGDHELGKMSLFGERGGMRLASWNRAESELGLAPFWTLHLGAYVFVGIASSLVALPVFGPELLPEEGASWENLRIAHLNSLRTTLNNLEPHQRAVLFCHDPTALPFLWQDEAIRRKLSHVEATVIGHLHSPLLLWKSRLLSGMPPIRFLGNSIRRMSTALNQARVWPEFRVTLCPSLAGIQLLKDGGFYRLSVDPTAQRPLELERCRLRLPPRV